jgi:methionyl-tRNA formyltransferase
LTIWRARVATAPSGEPGAVIPSGKERVVVAAGSGAVEPLEIQPEGKRRMPAADFARGYRPGPHDRLGD